MINILVLGLTERALRSMLDAGDNDGSCVAIKLVPCALYGLLGKHIRASMAIRLGIYQFNSDIFIFAISVWVFTH